MAARKMSRTSLSILSRTTFLEKLIGLDGIREFPVYLCGAGMPDSPGDPSRGSNRLAL